MTDLEKQIVRELNDPVYTVDRLNDYINRDDNVFVNVPFALMSAAASGFYAAVKCIAAKQVKEEQDATND